ncbi:hypothetical protein RZS08_45995, partial [Arthrospira platensis SPKY1]|nr:hypothetical protein [Arthrospira platensis SPKY1]
MIATGIPERRAQDAHCLGLARLGHAAGDQRGVEIGQQTASFGGPISLVLQQEKLERAVLPEPHLGYAQTPVDLQLVDAS